MCSRLLHSDALRFSLVAVLASAPAKTIHSPTGMPSNPKRSRVALVFSSCSRQVIIASVWPWRAACVEFALWVFFPVRDSTGVMSLFSSGHPFLMSRYDSLGTTICASPESVPDRTTIKQYSLHHVRVLSAFPLDLWHFFFCLGTRREVPECCGMPCLNARRFREGHQKCAPG